MAGQDKIVIHIDPEVKEIVPTFLKHRHEDIEKISEAVKRSDFESVRRLGHQMKGAGGGYGFDGITKIGADLEACAKENNAGGILAALHELSDYLERLVVVDE